MFFVLTFNLLGKFPQQTIISSVVLTDFELPPRSSHFDSGPKDGKKQTTNQIDGLKQQTRMNENPCGY